MSPTVWGKIGKSGSMLRPGGFSMSPYFGIKNTFGVRAVDKNCGWALNTSDSRHTTPLRRIPDWNPLAAKGPPHRRGERSVIGAPEVFMAAATFM